MTSSVEFLKSFDAEGWHNLVAIKPDPQPGDEPVGVTIKPGDWEAAEKFIAAHEGRNNLYFSVNEPRPNAPNKKLKKTDIANLRAVYADVDPELGDLEQQRQAIRDRAEKVLSSAVPSLIIDSGGGLQFFWETHRTPLDDLLRRRAENQSRGIAHLMDGDGVCNVDHIMRLPGTRNIPGAKKLAKGRKVAVAKVLAHRADRYALEELERFYKPREAEDSEDKSEEIAAVQRSLDIRFIRGHHDYSALPAELRERFEAVLAHDEPLAALWRGDEPPEDVSSSGWRFALARALKPHGGYSADEFGALCWVWDKADPDKITERSVARDWARAGKSPDQIFEVMPDVPQNLSKSKKSELPPIHWTRPSEWAGREPKEREWEVEGWIPRYEVCLLYGDGGIGKTLAIHHYATAAASGRDWLGQKTRQARVMCFFCEDSEDELLRRQIDINRALGVTFDDIDERLRIASRKYMDNLLALWDRNTGGMKRQAVWEQLRADAVAFGAEVLVIDTIADTYGGNEIDRGQVNAFVKSCLGRLAQEIGGTVIALGHPSMSGKQSGSGTSGSTAWSNAVRSRMYLRYPKGVEKGNVRELEGMKLNYGPKGALLKLRWDKGAFEVIASNVPATRTGVDAARVAGASVEDAARDAVVAAVRMCEGVPMNMKPNSTNYAPKVLRARQGDLLEAFSAGEVEAALRKMEGDGTLSVVPAGRTASRHVQYGYAVTDKVSAETDIFE